MMGYVQNLRDSNIKWELFSEKGDENRGGFLTPLVVLAIVLAVCTGCPKSERPAEVPSPRVTLPGGPGIQETTPTLPPQKLEVEEKQRAEVAAEVPKPDPVSQKVIERIKALGGRYELDPKTGSIVMIDLNSRQLPATDEDLELFAQVPSLQRLYLFGAEIHDRGVEAIAKLSNLRELILENTEITLKGVEAVAQLKDLEMLNLRRSTYLDDGALELIGKMTSLRRLFLLYNNFTDAGMSHLAQLEKLELLDLRGCLQVGNTGIERLKPLKNLRILRIRSYAVTDSGLEQLKNFEKLRILSLEDCGITDAGLVHLKELPLQSLRVRASLCNERTARTFPAR